LVRYFSNCSDDQPSLNSVNVLYSGSAVLCVIALIAKNNYELLWRHGAVSCVIELEATLSTPTWKNNTMLKTFEQVASNLPLLRKMLRFMLLTHLVILALYFIEAWFVPLFPVAPPEIREAVGAVEERLANREYGIADLIFLAAILIFLVTLIVQLWAMWQLYHFNKRGIVKFVCSVVVIYVIDLISSLVIPFSRTFIPGYWTSNLELSVIGILGMLEGFVLAICILKPEIFSTPNEEHPFATVEEIEAAKLKLEKLETDLEELGIAEK